MWTVWNIAGAFNNEKINIKKQVYNWGLAL